MSARGGQTLVEFLLVVILFLSMFAYAIEVAELNIARSMLNVAAYSAARKFAVTQDLEVATVAAERYLKKVAEEESVRVDVSPRSPEFGSVFVMNVTMESPILLPLAAQFFGGGGGEEFSFSRRDLMKGGHLVGGQPQPIPPTRADLGLTPDQQFTITQVTYVGYLQYQFEIWGEETITSDLGDDDADYPQYYDFHCVTGPLPPDHHPSPGDCGEHDRDSGLFDQHHHRYRVTSWKKIPWGPPYYDFEITVETHRSVAGDDENVITLSSSVAMSAD